VKIKRFSWYALICIIISGLTVLLILPHPDDSEKSQLNIQDQKTTPKRGATASISKGTILLLLAVGVVGALGVSRKKKDNGSHDEFNETPDAMRSYNLREEKHNLVGKNS
jgi:hypothetical protein